MNRQHVNLNRHFQRHRRLAATLVLLWLASWTVLALEPCCEAVAAAMPHAHTTANNHPYSAGTTPPPLGHGHDTGVHCPSIESPAGEAPYLPISGEPKSGFDSPNGLFTHLPRTLGLTPRLISRHVLLLRRYLPTGRALFLRTERLRI